MNPVRALRDMAEAWEARAANAKARAASERGRTNIEGAAYFDGYAQALNDAQRAAVAVADALELVNRRPA